MSLTGIFSVKRGLFGLVVLLLCGIWLFLASDVLRQLDQLATASSDNVQWTLSQGEVELAALDKAVSVAALDPEASLVELRRRFDIFYSRVTTLAEGPSFATLRRDPDANGSLMELREFLNRNVSYFDSEDPVLREALPRIQSEVVALRPVMRRVALKGIERFANQSDQNRTGVSDTLSYVALVTTALIGVLMLMLVVMARLARVAERNARNSRAVSDRIETIISTSIDAVIVIDLEGKVVEYNGAAEKIFGYTHAEAVGQSMAELIVPDHLRQAHNKGMERFIKYRQERVVNQGIVQLEAKRRDGTLFPVELSIASVQRPEGEIFVGYIRDISRRVEAENDLKSARDRAIAGEKSKANMLAVMSHEMRTPLNGMLGTLDLMETLDLDSKTERYVKTIRSSGNVLLGHVNDVLDISSLDAGRMTMTPRIFDLHAFLEELVDTYSQPARENGNVIVLNAAGRELKHVYSDPVRVRQILINLLGNAIKFTRNGQITLEVECLNGLDEVEIRVIDDGIGMEKEDLSRIFEDFVTLDSSYARNNNGTGLGLGISARMAKALGAEIGADSAPGEGSRFWLRLSLKPPAGQELPAPDASSGGARSKAAKPAHTIPARNVLLVEDNAVNRLVAREMLERDGHRVEEAHNGREGVALASRKAFDVILMDISMPEMDGTEATRAIRSGGGQSADSPIIATTAHVLQHDVQRFRDAGMTDVLAKPISIAALRRIMETFASDADDEDEAELLEAEQPLFDWEQARTVRRTLNKERFAAAMDAVCDELEAFIDTLDAQVADPAQHDALAAEAHRLAGSSGIFGGLRLAELLREFEVQLRLGPDDTLDEAADDIKACWSETVEIYRDERQLELT
ncbi:Aerobic respiration control sensor protein ArcB [Roseivivax sp. THAF40]|uniref:hybrid sensor histidine kinase/response regulator n=1 Tax=unclassified Roseivivax TaxID=2639302 RepID=UPI0012688A24|nr:MULTISPECIES: PAS domain-containing hybrid sensor histidine kinase/response regulator [unclassified Roseivivax]QFS83725.1 Aerobic respiration control sensor protein ArcB [Roseivivax sp. THAF197b]QFT47527.1 Aerobic respiration control sensor protein ArcB [Roseivivax sp. THAF40]